jgi:hypothetical protein
MTCLSKTKDFFCCTFFLKICKCSDHNVYPTRNNERWTWSSRLFDQRERKYIHTHNNNASIIYTRKFIKQSTLETSSEPKQWIHCSPSPKFVLKICNKTINFNMKKHQLCWDFNEMKKKTGFSRVSTLCYKRESASSKHKNWQKSALVNWCRNYFITNYWGIQSRTQTRIGNC